ncbi:MAG TPA: hypothetical protein VF008_26260 [Niastella sp.]
MRYKVTELPLTQEDINKLRKTLSDSYKMNILLLPLLVIIYFWGALYFGIFTAFVIICNVIFTKNYLSTQKELTKSKIVITGIVTEVRKNEETLICFGDEELDITYANVTFPIEVNDLISVHYSKKENNRKGQILNVVKVY